MSLKVLFCAADPRDESRLRLQDEQRAIQERIRSSRERERIEFLEPCVAAQPADLLRALSERAPTVVHFSGHGSASAVAFQNEKGEAVPVGGKALAELFRLMSDHVRCVILNACDTEDLARQISEHVDFVVGMSAAIGDEGARQFSEGFYIGLGAAAPLKMRLRLEGSVCSSHRRQIPMLLFSL